MTEACIVTPHPKSVPNPAYSEEARRSGTQGNVLLTIVINEKGDVTDAKIKRGLEPGLDQNSLDAVKQWNFDPATIDGKPVPVQLNVQVSFHQYSGPSNTLGRVPRKP